MRELTIRLARNMIAAAGILSALVVATGPAADGTVAGTAVATVASERPTQPPPPPPGWPPPSIEQPGQQPPGPGQYDKPPPGNTPTGDPICQDIMDVPNINQPCYDPSTIA